MWSTPRRDPRSPASGHGPAPEDALEQRRGAVLESAAHAQNDAHRAFAPTRRPGAPCPSHHPPGYAAVTAYRAADSALVRFLDRPHTSRVPHAARARLAAMPARTSSDRVTRRPRRPRPTPTGALATAVGGDSAQPARPGHGRAGGLLPLLVVVARGAWQAVAGRSRAWAATRRGSSAPRVRSAVGSDPARAARAHLPGSLERGLRVTAGRTATSRSASASRRFRVCRVPVMPAPAPGSSRSREPRPRIRRGRPGDRRIRRAAPARRWPLALAAAAILAGQLGRRARRPGGAGRSDGAAPGRRSARGGTPRAADRGPQPRHDRHRTAAA